MRDISPQLICLHSCGATYNKGITNSEVREEDHRANITQISATDPGLAAAVGQPETAELDGRANFRCTTPDYLPIAGALPNVPLMLEKFAFLRRDAKTVVPVRGDYLPNLYINCGMGSRGLSYAPLTAEIVARRSPVSRHRWSRRYQCHASGTVPDSRPEKESASYLS